MTRIKPIRIYRAICAAACLNIKNKAVQAKLASLIPKPVKLSDGRIDIEFLPHIADAIVNTFKNTKPDATKIIRVLTDRGLVGAREDLGSVYQAILREREVLGRVVNNQKELRQVNRRLLTLQNLVRELGVDAEQNIKVAVRCIREALGYSGVRVYSVDLEKGTWFHRYKEGEQGKSRFEAAKVPEQRSEKGFITDLLRGDVPPSEIERARQDGLFDWKINGEWAYLHIPDRSQCEFVETIQLAKDEGGDPTQKRKGYGDGKAREILYLLLGDTAEERVDVYLITNWEAQKPLFVDRKKDIELLQTFAAAQTRATRLATTYQKLQDASLIDDLTKIRNRRFFNNKIVEEFARAKRYNHPLSLLLIDIDNFKLVNDIHGHQAGDIILKAVSKGAAACVRNRIDTIARYGGEEIAVILPETDTAGALQFAERIRQGVEAMRTRVNSKKNGALNLRVAVSIGVATFPQHADSYGDLIFAADNALYSAKEGGRNMVVVSQNSLI